MSSSVLFSVITIGGGDSSETKLTLDSIQSQAFDHDRISCILIVAKDTSLDLSQYSFKISARIGLDTSIYDAMNLGLALSRNSALYTLFLNSGDCFYSISSLEQAYQSLDSHQFPDILICGSHLKGKPSRRFSNGNETYCPRMLPFGVLEKWPIHQSFVFKNSCNGVWFDNTIKYAADLVFMETCIQQSRAIHVEPLLLTIYDRSGISSVSANLYRRRRELLSISLLLLFRFGPSYRVLNTLMRSIASLLITPFGA